MDPQVFQSATVVSNLEVGANVKYLKLQPNTPFSYQPGQFFILRMKDQKGEYVERSYSAANYDDSGILEFVIRIEPNGHMTSLINQLSEGAVLDIKGPFGRFGNLSPDCKHLVLIGGGVGVSPIRGMIQKWDKDGRKIPLQLFYGFRTADDFLFREEFEGYCSSQSFELVASTSRPSEQWEGLRGYILEHFKTRLSDPRPDTSLYICGPPDMVKASREKLLELGFERKQIHVEAW